MVVCLSSCGWLYQSQPKDNEAIKDISGLDLQVPSFAYTNQFGDPFSLEDMKGTMWIANMIFTRCPSVCNLMTPNMRLIQEEIKEEGLSDKVKLVSFTVDPDFDQPEILRKYGENVGGDFSIWTFVTGYSNEEIAAFAKEGFQSLVMDIEDSDDIIHGTTFFIINEEGKPIYQFDGLDPDIEPVIQLLKNY